MSSSTKRSVLLWVQHLLGIGHLQRTLRIAEALVERGIVVTVVSGGMPQPLARHPTVELVQLPPLRAHDASFALFDEAGAPLYNRLREWRRDALLSAFASARPDAMVLEGFPFARRAFRFELDPLIAAARAASWRPPVICSVRDIVVVRDDPQRHREIVDRVRRDIGRVLVHGDPALIPFEASFPAAPEIADRLVYTGYVAQRGMEAGAGAASRGDAGEVLVSAGGGAAGLVLLNAALAARRTGCLADLRWRIITGTNLPEGNVTALRENAPAGVTIERFRDDFATLLRACRVSVSQAGYNTILDLLTARARAVLVPFSAGHETEQALRAEHLALLGAAEIVHESELSPAALAAAIERVASRPPPSLVVDTAGAARSACEIDGMIGANRTSTGHFVVPADRGILAQ